MKNQIQVVYPTTLKRNSTCHPIRRSVPWLVMLGALLLLALKHPVVGADGGLSGANTAEGDNALQSLTTGTGNTAIGNSALASDTTGFGNTASGVNALQLNNGINNTATGAEALFNNTTGHDNTATGFDTLVSNRNGVFN